MLLRFQQSGQPTPSSTHVLVSCGGPETNAASCLLQEGQGEHECPWCAFEFQGLRVTARPALGLNQKCPGGTAVRAVQEATVQFRGTLRCRVDAFPQLGTTGVQPTLGSGVQNGNAVRALQSIEVPSLTSREGKRCVYMGGKHLCRAVGGSPVFSAALTSPLSQLVLSGEAGPGGKAGEGGRLPKARPALPPHLPLCTGVLPLEGAPASSSTQLSPGRHAGTICILNNSTHGAKIPKRSRRRDHRGGAGLLEATPSRQVQQEQQAGVPRVSAKPFWSVKAARKAQGGVFADTVPISFLSLFGSWSDRAHLVAMF